MGYLQTTFRRENLSLAGCSSAEPASVSVQQYKIQISKLYLQPVEIPSHFHDISVIDQIGVGPGGRYTVFNPRKFDNMEFAYAGISVFDKDTVSIINYSSRKKDLERMSEENGGRYSGVIYIAVNNLAIVRHTLRIRSSELDIIYKNFGGQYFPYSLRTEHPIYSDKSKYLLLQTISLRNIKRENVEVVENLPQHWFVEDVAFNEGYWDANYPVDR